MDYGAQIPRALRTTALLNDTIRVIIPRGQYSGIALPDTLALGLCDLVFEHNHSIVELVGVSGRIGTALTLMRPLIDTYRRAVWLHTCADDARAEGILNGTSGFEKMNDDLTEVFRNTSSPGRLNNPKEFVDRLNGFTHSGREHIRYRFDENLIIRPSYPPEFIYGLLQVSSRFTTEAAILMFGILKSSHLSDVVAAIYNQQFGEDE